MCAREFLQLIVNKEIPSGFITTRVVNRWYVNVGVKYEGMRTNLLTFEITQLC
jgi:hypothetical protein